MSIYDFITSKSSKVENTKDITNITENVLPDVTIDTTKNVKYDSENKGHPDAGYFNELDPKTGFRYDIPMLRRDDPGYYYNGDGSLPSKTDWYLDSLGTRNAPTLSWE